MKAGKSKWNKTFYSLISGRPVGWAVTIWIIIFKANKKICGVYAAPSQNSWKMSKIGQMTWLASSSTHWWLQQLLDEEISKVDPTFFLRLKESKFYSEDKDERMKHTLFLDKGFTDKSIMTNIQYTRKDILIIQSVWRTPGVSMIHHIIKPGHLLENTPSDELVPFQDAYITWGIFVWGIWSKLYQSI